jgi:hypothetical protein
MPQARGHVRSTETRSTDSWCRVRAIPIHRKREFGRLVRIDEVEKGLVSNYAVALSDLCDQQQWVPALEAHVRRLGRAPRLAAADRGFWNSANEKAAASSGCRTSGSAGLRPFKR